MARLRSNARIRTVAIVMPMVAFGVGVWGGGEREWRGRLRRCLGGEKRGAWLGWLGGLRLGGFEK